MTNTGNHFTERKKPFLSYTDLSQYQMTASLAP